MVGPFVRSSVQRLVGAVRCGKYVLVVGRLTRLRTVAAATNVLPKLSKPLLLLLLCNCPGAASGACVSCH